MTVPSAVHRTLLVARNRGVGRELLRARVVAGDGWAGITATTPLELAQDLVGVDLAREGRRLADDFDRQALLDEALDAALDAHGTPEVLELAEGTGFREAVADAVQALRLAGIDAAALAGAKIEDRPKRTWLADVLARYEALLEAKGFVDGPDVLRRAIRKVETPGFALPGDDLRLMPDLGTRGLAGRFLAALRSRGATVESAPPVRGLDRPAVLGEERPAKEPPRFSFLHAAGDAPPPALFDPSIELFAAASVEGELREVLRRVIAAGRRWDEVEIVATDPTAYGCALDALATRLGIPVTYAVGLPVERTRQGRAAMAYLRWIQSDFPAPLVREMLETGDLRARAPGGERVSGPRLARRLRRLRVGWGRERYRSTIGSALRALDEVRDDDERFTPEELAERRAREREELEALRDLFDAILDATPPVPDRLGKGAARVSAAALAEGLLAFLEHVPAGAPVEKEAQGRLKEALERVRKVLTREAAFGAALTVLRSHIEIRVPSPGTEGPLPWSSAGTALHLADLEHGGRTGRAMTFVVGLGAERFPGSGLQDPILLDADRRRLAPDDLPTASERLAERRWMLASLLARLEGTVTLSWAAWSAAEGREVAPAADLLQAFRLQAGDATADYEAMAKALRPLASAVPRGAARLDAADVWLAALEEERILLAGLPQVLAAHPGLAAGIAARDARASAEFTAHDGRIGPRPDAIDPRQNREIVVSTSTAEALGECPLRYLHKAVLGIRAPDDPEFDPGAWLDPMRKGSLLHDLYEELLTRAREEGIGYAEDRFEAIALEVLDRQLERYRRKVPVPSDVVYEAEVEDLRADVRSFVEMTRELAADPERGADWVAPLERWFGYRPDTPAVDVPLPGGTIRAGGRLDRVDRLPDGRYVVVDYKTGGTFGHGAEAGTYRGGRRLQHVLYTRVAPVLYGGAVARMEFHFPTLKGERRIVPYGIERLREGERILDRLFDLVAAGRFLPTEERNDCRFCDHKPICRVTTDDAGKVRSSPRAAWGKEHWDSDAYAAFREVRDLGWGG